MSVSIETTGDELDALRAVCWGRRLMRLRDDDWRALSAPTLLQAQGGPFAGKYCLGRRSLVVTDEQCIDAGPWSRLTPWFDREAQVIDHVRPFRKRLDRLSDNTLLPGMLPTLKDLLLPEEIAGIVFLESRKISNDPDGDLINDLWFSMIGFLGDEQILLAQNAFCAGQFLYRENGLSPAQKQLLRHLQTATTSSVGLVGGSQHTTETFGGKETQVA